MLLSRVNLAQTTNRHVCKGLVIILLSFVLFRPFFFQGILCRAMFSVTSSCFSPTFQVESPGYEAGVRRLVKGVGFVDIFASRCLIVHL